MEKYLVPVAQSSSETKPKPVKRREWMRTLIEINGKFKSKYRHDSSNLIMQSYAEVGAFPHKYHICGEPCQTHVNLFANSGFGESPNATCRHGISSLEFDSKGVYLASVTKSGCLMVHDFDNLYCPGNSKNHSGWKEDETKHLLHVSTNKQLDVVRWNLANQDEIACTSLRSSEIHIYDIGYVSSEPIEVLRKRPTITVHGCTVRKGLCDIAFYSNDSSRLLASDTSGVINVWDRRISDLPCLEISTGSSSPLNSIKMSADNEIIFGASKGGTIYMWDLRGGRSSTAFGNHKEGSYAPLIALKIAPELGKIGSLRAQSDIASKEIHSIELDPSCPHQLAFHLDDGWSGVFDIHKLQVTHIHCPPPPWLDNLDNLVNLSYLRKPCWLPQYSIFCVGSSSTNGLYLLDFFPDCSSPCHVNYDDDKQSTTRTSHFKQNRFLPLSESVTACVAHPLNGTMIAGTKQSSLLVISQI